MDSRDQGKSADSPDTLTYEKMTDDLAALLDHLKIGPVNVLGWSDGGIEASAARHPPSGEGEEDRGDGGQPQSERGRRLAPRSLGLVKSMMDAIPAAARRHAAGPARAESDRHDARRAAHRAEGARRHHRADAGAGERSRLIRDEHTVDIYHHIPNSQLAIFPNATHMVPFDDPATFNAAVERFLRDRHS